MAQKKSILENLDKEFQAVVDKICANANKKLDELNNDIAKQCDELKEKTHKNLDRVMKNTAKVPQKKK